MLVDELHRIIFIFGIIVTNNNSPMVAGLHNIKISVCIRLSDEFTKIHPGKVNNTLILPDIYIPPSQGNH